MDRFGDDLTEEVIQYLRFEDKVRLKKCPNITKVKVWYLNIKTKVISMFGQYCPRLKSLTHNIKDVNFYRKYGHKLEELSIRGENDEIKHSLEFCPNLKIFYSTDLSVLFNEDKEFLPKLEEIRETFEIYPQYVNEMQILVNKYSKTIKRFDVTLRYLSAEELKKCIDCISRFEKLRHLKLNFYSYRNIEQPIDDCLSLIGQKCTKLLKLDLFIYYSISITVRFFSTFSKL